MIDLTKPKLIKSIFVIDHENKYIESARLAQLMTQAKRCGSPLGTVPVELAAIINSHVAEDDSMHLNSFFRANYDTRPKECDLDDAVAKSEEVPCRP